MVVAKFESCINEDACLRVIQQLREISCPSSTAGVAPKVKARTRGRLILNSYSNPIIESKKGKGKKENNDSKKGKLRKMTHLQRDILVALGLS
ncbi:hypothetical protein Syun_001933 [Stephania yunnanensis]|uniref:Uncharacterized protein n=1 Tax=Stephania yunnanensis TaxID=152371 RepID=A0AAP0Q7L4_9MAGN